MSALRIGSLCSGAGLLDMAVMDVLDARVAWHAQYDPDDRHQWAAQILAHHWPAVPNHGDITSIDWAAAEPVDILTAGFPCQPVSNAGKRKGHEDDRWLWPDVASAIGVLRPRAVVLENVAALIGRGLDRVLADLAALGFDAEWTCLRASDVGAPHRRERIFILAWPAADAAHVGHERPRPARLGWPGSADGRLTAPDADRAGALAELDREPHRPETLDEHDQLNAAGCVLDWGDYAPAIDRWERVMMRPAPAPTEPGRTGERLSPAFVEWMMGAPAGHITGVPGIPRTAQLKAAGNGVVRQQGAAAVEMLLDRAPAWLLDGQEVAA